MLFRRKMPRSCSTCLYGTDYSDHQILCTKRGVVTDTDSCRKFRYDPCKRIPPCLKAPNFDHYKDEDFRLE